MNFIDKIEKKLNIFFTTISYINEQKISIIEKYFINYKEDIKEK